MLTPFFPPPHIFFAFPFFYFVCVYFNILPNIVWIFTSFIAHFRIFHLKFYDFTDLSLILHWHCQLQQTKKMSKKYTFKFCRTRSHKQRYLVPPLSVPTSLRSDNQKCESILFKKWLFVWFLCLFLCCRLLICANTATHCIFRRTSFSKASARRPTKTNVFYLKSELNPKKKSKYQIHNESTLDPNHKAPSNLLEFSVPPKTSISKHFRKSNAKKNDDGRRSSLENDKRYLYTRFLLIYCCLIAHSRSASDKSAKIKLMKCQFWMQHNVLSTFLVIISETKTDDS